MMINLRRSDCQNNLLVLHSSSTRLVIKILELREGKAAKKLELSPA